MFIALRRSQHKRLQAGVQNVGRDGIDELHFQEFHRRNLRHEQAPGISAAQIYLLQILIEAVVLASAGGAMGVGLGALVTMLLGQIFGLTMHISAAYVILAIGVSTIVGVASGWYPASRAARLDPVTALRAD